MLKIWSNFDLYIIVYRLTDKLVSLANCILSRPNSVVLSQCNWAAQTVALIAPMHTPVEFYRWLLSTNTELAIISAVSAAMHKLSAGKTVNAQWILMELGRM